jgi:hypothetical protein
MKWFRKKEKPVVCDHHICQCKGLITRQTTLEEFDFGFREAGQKTITTYSGIPTIRVGMLSKKKDYRGLI